MDKNNETTTPLTMNEYYEHEIVLSYREDISKTKHAQCQDTNITRPMDISGYFVLIFEFFKCFWGSLKTAAIFKCRLLETH